MNTQFITDCCNLIKKFGLGIILFVFFLYNYNAINKERAEMQKTYTEITQQTVVVLIKLDDKIARLEELSQVQQSELKELRYELRRTNDLLNQPAKRFITE